MTGNGDVCVWCVARDETAVPLWDLRLAKPFHAPIISLFEIDSQKGFAILATSDFSEPYPLLARAFSWIFITLQVSYPVMLK